MNLLRRLALGLGLLLALPVLALGQGIDGGPSGRVSSAAIIAALGGTPPTTGTLTSGNFPIANGASSLIDSGYAPAPTSQPVAFSYAGTASNSPVSLTGAVFTGGTGTTTFPALKIGNQAATSWSTNGTWLGVSAVSGNISNFIDLKTNDYSVHILSNAASPQAIFAGTSTNIYGGMIGASSIQTKALGSFCWSASTTATGGCDASLTRRGAANVVFGAAAAALPVAYTISGQSSRSGTDINVGGATVTLESGNGTGTGTISQYIIKTPTVVGSGTGAQTLTARLTIDSAAATFANTTLVYPTPFTLGATSVTSTGTQLNYLNAATGTTGTASTNVVYSASPTLSGTAVTANITVGGNVQQTSGTTNYTGVTTNSVDAFSVTVSPAITAYTTGAMYMVKFNAANTTTTPTVNMNGLGAKTMVKRASTAMAANDILANGFYLLMYNGTNMQVVNPAVP